MKVWERRKGGGGVKKVFFHCQTPNSYLPRAGRFRAKGGGNEMGCLFPPLFPPLSECGRDLFFLRRGTRKKKLNKLVSIFSAEGVRREDKVAKHRPPNSLLCAEFLESRYFYIPSLFFFFFFGENAVLFRATNVHFCFFPRLAKKCTDTYCMYTCFIGNKTL